MIELDNKVKDIFKGLVNSGTKYLKQVVGNTLTYKICSQKIIVSVLKHKRDTVLETNKYTNIEKLAKVPAYLMLYQSGDCIYFALSIDGIANNYIVHGLDRVEEAQILNKLDQTLQEFEDNALNCVLSELDDKSLDDEF